MSAGTARLQYALKSLRERWDITREHWADGVAQDFEKNHLEPLEHQVNHALIGMDKLGEVLSRIRQACQ